MEYALVIESVAQLKKWINRRRKKGFLSAHCYLPPDVNLQHEVERYCKGLGYQTIFIFGQVIKAHILTEARILL